MIERLLSKIQKDAHGCWNFTGFRLPKGYGRIQGYKRGQVELAHRFSWMLHRGPIPDGIQVLHKCDNPPCVNPDHLFLGTQADNMHDASTKGRMFHNRPLPSTRGERHWKVKLTLEQVREIKERSSEPRRQIAKDYGVRPQYISQIICGRKWAWA